MICLQIPLVPVFGKDLSPVNGEFISCFWAEKGDFFCLLFRDYLQFKIIFMSEIHILRYRFWFPS